MTLRAPDPSGPRLPLALGLVAVGGAAGACLRYSATLLWPHQLGEFPMGDLVANLVGCLGMGVFLGVVSLLTETPEKLTLLIATGFLGGLTTFSSYAEDGVLLGDDGALVLAGIYVGFTVLAGWLLLRVGWKIGRRGTPANFGRTNLGPQEMGD